MTIEVNIIKCYIIRNDPEGLYIYFTLHQLFKLDFFITFNNSYRRTSTHKFHIDIQQNRQMLIFTIVDLNGTFL